MASARNGLKSRLFTIRPTLAGIRRLSSFAARWGEAYFYTDGLRFSVSNTERADLNDLWILTTNGTVTAYEIEQLLMDELE